MSKKTVLNKKEIIERYSTLLSDTTISSQKRGFEFEALIYSLLYNENLEPRSGYKPKGEQIDGSFFWSGQTFLLEAKWVADPLPASSIYAFKGKLDGKFHTTSGVFLSANGYSEDVEDALRFGKSLNILLFDENDIDVIFTGEATFTEVLKFKLREAGDTGSLKVPYTIKERVEEILETKSIDESDSGDKNKLYEQQGQYYSSQNKTDLIVFVEGQSDVSLTKSLFEPLSSLHRFSYKIAALDGASNIRQLPALINLYSEQDNTMGIVVILDDDQATVNMHGLIKNIKDQFKDASIPVNPSFLFMNKRLKLKLSQKVLSLKELRQYEIFRKIESFTRTIGLYEYDTEKELSHDALLLELVNLKWDFEAREVIAYDEDHGRDYGIESLQGLVEHLNEKMIHAVQGEMPTSWLKQQVYLDYETEVREYLNENYLEEIEKMGWNIDEL